jgi:Ser/Thr protein kinase RdoA (MazF antagonist)
MAEICDDVINRAADVVADRLRTTVAQVEPFGSGAINQCYKLVTATRPVVLKVFRSRDWPEEGKLHWIEDQLRRRDIAHPQILAYSRCDEFFINGYVIFEHVAGTDAHTLMRQKQLSATTFYERLGELLGRVHAIRINKFGLVNGGAGMYASFLGRLLRRGEGLDRLKRNEHEGPELRRRVAAKVRSNLKALAVRCAPALTHGDPHPKNCLLTERGELVLVDWDNATSSLGLRDYALSTYLRRKETPTAHGEAGLRQVGKSFFRRYGRLDFAPAEIVRLEQTWHLIWTYNSLARLRENDPVAYRTERDYLSSLM